MSIPVPLPELAQALARYGLAYLLTAGAQGAPRALAVQPRLADGELLVAGLGQRARAHVEARPEVALIWPPLQEGGHSLIVDGQARVDGDQLRIQPLHAVLHRPAPR